MDPLDVFGVLHAPARLAYRLLLCPKYLFHGAKQSEWWPDKYAKDRYGADYMRKPWILFDLEGLEHVENVINDLTDPEDILRFRDSHLDLTRLVAVVAALVTQAATSSLSLPKLEETHYAARAFMNGSLVLSLIAVFFTCIVQRELGGQVVPAEIRAWLSVRRKQGDNARLQSSVVAYQLLQAPFELLGVSVIMFIAGLGIYEGTAYTRKIGLNTSNGEPVSNIGALVPFVIGTIFVLSILGFLNGRKELEDHMRKKTMATSATGEALDDVTSANIRLPSVQE